MYARRCSAIVAVLVLCSGVGGVASAQTSTPTPFPAFTPTNTPTSNRSADLSLSMAASPLPARVGQNLTYTLTVRNNGPSAVLNPSGGAAYSVTDTLPAGVTFVSVSPSNCTYDGASVRCNMPTLGRGNSVQVVVVVRPTATGSITNSAVAQAFSVPDPWRPNNTATLTTNVQNAVATRTPTPPPVFTPTATPTPVPTLAPLRAVFLRSSGAGADRVLYLDTVAPTADAPKFQDSNSLQSGLTNSWVEVGTWPAQPSVFTGTLGELGHLHVWLGLKNSDDVGTKFDLRAEAWKNGQELVAAGERSCVDGVLRDPARARETAVPLHVFSPAYFEETDVLSLRVVARIGSRCAGPNGGSASGVRLYYGGLRRPAGFGTTASALVEAEE